MPWQSLHHCLFDTVQQGVVYQDAEGTIVSMNPAAERILGKIRAEFLGQSSLSVEHDTLREDGSPFPGLEHPAMVALRTGREVCGVLMQVYNPREQRYRCIKIDATPLFHEGESTPYQVYTIFEDVTEHRAAEVRLRETQQLTEALNRINETIHASLDIDEIMQRLVSESATALGCDTASVSIRRDGRWTIRHVHGFPASLVGAQSQDDEERHAMLAFHTRQPVAIADALHDERVDPEHMRWHKIHAVLVAPLIVRDEPFGALFFNYHHGPHPFSQAQVQFASQLAATAAIALENGRLFDEHLKFEQELRQNREWLQVTLASIGDGVIATDVQGRVTFLNPVAEALTGWQQDEAWGRPIGDVFCIIDEQTRRPAEDIVGRVLREGHALALANSTTLVAKDGREEMPIEDSAAPILDAAGNVAGVVLVFHDVTEKRRAQQALQESEERFRTVLENSLDAAYRRNLETGHYDYMSPAFEKMTGWSVEEMMAADFSDLLARIHPDDRAGVQNELERTRAACEAGQPATGTLEYRYLTKDGSYRWLGDHINVLPDSEGKALYRLGIIRDIGLRKQREQELWQLNRTLEARSHSDWALLRATDEAQFMQEVCRIILEDCGHAMVWIGFAEHDEQKTVRPVAYAGFEEGYLETLQLTWADTARGRGPAGTAVRTGKPCFCRNMLTDPKFEPWREEALVRGYASSLALPLLSDGKAFGLLAIYFRQPDPFREDEVALLQGLADDLAYGIRMLRLREAHAQAEKALRQAHDELEQRVLQRTAELQASEERFRQLAENINEVFWLIEPESWQVLYISPAYEGIWGQSREEMAESLQSFFDTIHPDDREKVVQQLTSNWQSYDGDFHILRPDGTARWIQLRSFPVHNERGEVYRLAGVAVDRTDQKATEAALIQAERLTVAGKLAASLAHEINNPLQSVIGCLGLAQGAVEKGKDPGVYLQIARQEVKRAAQIVSQLRSLGRPIQDDHKELTDLNNLLNDVLVLNEKHLQTHKIEVIWEPDTGLPLVPLMPDLMRQVLLNLVINAADAMPAGGQLRLRTERTESPAGVQAVVADTGTGIPPDVLPHIFEAFYSTKSEGLGVGLFVSQSIVQQHGGRIAVESRRGDGTTFTVWLAA